MFEVFIPFWNDLSVMRYQTQYAYLWSKCFVSYFFPLNISQSQDKKMIRQTFQINFDLYSSLEWPFGYWPSMYYEVTYRSWGGTEKGEGVRNIKICDSVIHGWPLMRYQKQNWLICGLVVDVTSQFFITFLSVVFQQKSIFSNFSCMFLNPNIFSQFEF